MLKSDLSYTPLEFFATEGPDGIPESFDSQEYLIKKAREDYLHSLEVREEQAALRSATARVQRIRDREMKESPVTPLVENPETGEPLTVLRQRFLKQTNPCKKQQPMNRSP